MMTRISSRTPASAGRRTAAAAFLALALAVTGLGAIPAAAVSLDDAVLGSADAPVTVIEYSSLGCGHCASFHDQVMPDIVRTFIDTGQVRWIVRDFPLARLPLAGAVIARCGGPAAYPRLIDVLFRTQDTWMRSQDPLGELERLARTAGIDRDRFDACLDDQRLIGAIIERTREAQERYGISGTPSFIVNGEVIVGAVPFAVMRAILERHVGRR